MTALHRGAALRRAVRVATVLGLCSNNAAANVAFEVEFRDVDGFGFFDPSPAEPVGGNSATTVGEQRRAALEEATSIWSEALDGSMPVRVGVSFLPTVDCEVAAGAEPERYVSGEPGLEPHLTYPVALAERLLERELNANDVDIELFFNEQFCDDQPSWYLGLDAKPADEAVDFVTVALHELAHGLGLTTNVSVYDGQSSEGKLDVYASLIYDTAVAKAWSAMSTTEIAASALRQRALAWGGESTRRYAIEHFERGLPQLTAAPTVAGLIGLLSETNVGPRLTERQSARLRLAGAGAACEPIANNGVPSVLLATAGDCGVREKAEVAAASGAVVLLIAATATTSPPAPLRAEGEGPLPLPVFGITRDDGQRLEESDGVTVQLSVDPTRLVGADIAGRPLLFVGIPPVHGVNLVHWDTLARPGGLMTPIIETGVAWRDVGLEAAALRDLGWPTVCGNGRWDAGEVCDRGEDGANCASDCDVLAPDAAAPMDGGRAASSSMSDAPSLPGDAAATRPRAADAGPPGVSSNSLETPDAAVATPFATLPDAAAPLDSAGWGLDAAASTRATQLSRPGGCACKVVASSPALGSPWGAATIVILAFASMRRRRRTLPWASPGLVLAAWLAWACAAETTTSKQPGAPVNRGDCGGAACREPTPARPSPRALETPPLPYSPELAEAPPALSAEDALRLLGGFNHSGALGAPDRPACSKLRQPLAQTCSADEADVVELVTKLLVGYGFTNESSETESLFRLEGCKAFPKGALRWLRIRSLGQCGLELATPALARGGPDLDPTVRGLLVGEVLAEQCRRSVEPVTPYRGGYTAERFQQWRQQELLPWHERTLKRLETCHGIAVNLPAGTPGRTTALTGYARAVAKFVSAHRGSQVDETLVNDDAQRSAYFAELDAITSQFDELRNAANDEARQEAAREGDFDGYVSSFEPPLLVRREPFSVLGLPRLPRLGATTNQQRILTGLPVQLSALLVAYAPLETAGYDASEARLSALLRRGLPQVIRAQLGRELASMSVSAVERQRLHELLAAGLLRLGLVTQDRASLGRAAYELSYAEPNVTTAWLGAIARALLTPDEERTILPWFGYTPAHSEHGTADLSGFTPELLKLAAEDPLYASLAVDHAVLRSIGTWPLEMRRGRELAATQLARHPGVPSSQRRCVNNWAAVCTWTNDEWGIEGGLRHPCACMPFPWRVEDRDQ